MKSIEEDGVWFLPNNPEKKVSGRLNFSMSESPQLYLFDVLEEIEFRNKISHKSDFDKSDFEIINGNLVNGRKATLCYCYQAISWQAGAQTSKIYAKYLLIGHHFKTIDEISFKDVSLRYKNLEAWVDLPNFEINWSTNEEQSQVKELTLKQLTLEPIELGRLLEFSLALYDKPIELMNLQIQNIFGVRIGGKISLEDRKSIVLRADSGKKLEDIIDVIYLLQELLIFASGQMTYPYDVQSGIVVIEQGLKIPDHLSVALMAGLTRLEPAGESYLGVNIYDLGEEMEPVEEEKLLPIEIYFQVEELDSFDAKFDPKRVLFEFKDVKEQFNELLNLWERNSKELQPIIDLYLRLTYIPKRHINDFFLSLAQAIEAFHSLAHDGRYLDKKIYRSVVRKTLEQAVDSIPDTIFLEDGREIIDLRNYKRILKEEKLSHLNSYSLRERLEDIVTEYKSCLPDNFFISIKDQSDFLKKVRKTRNYLTHLSSQKDKYVVLDQDLMTLNRKLKILLEVCLLKQLGLKDLDIKSILSNKK